MDEKEWGIEKGDILWVKENERWNDVVDTLSHVKKKNNEQLIGKYKFVFIRTVWTSAPPVLFHVLMILPFPSTIAS